MDITFVLRKFRKSIAGFTILALIASFAFSGLAFAFTDDDSVSSWATDYVSEASTDGWMTGNADGTFDPQGEITRQELAKVLVLAFLGEDYVDADYDHGFADSDDVSSWALDYVNTAALYEIMNGTGDGTDFDPLGTVNRATVAQALVNAAILTEDTSYGPTFNDVASSSWYYGAVETAYLYQLVDGKTATTFDPTGLATREAVAKMTSHALAPELRPDENDSDEDATLEIKVSSDTASAATLPSGATSVEVASWDFTAENGDVELDELIVHQYAISSLSTVSLYLYNGSERLTSNKSVRSSERTSSFKNLNLEIDEGDTLTLTVRADLGTTPETGELGLEIEASGSLNVGEADINGDFPLKAEKFSLSTVSVGTVTVTVNGSISDPQVGEDNVTVAKFKIEADTEDANLQEFGLFLSGIVDSGDVEGFELYVSGEDDAIATVDAVDGQDVVRFMIADGYEIAKGSTKTFTVKADFNTGRTGDTVKFYVDEDTDVVAIGETYHYGMIVDRSEYDGGTDGGNEYSSSTLEGGDITISSSSPTATDIAVNANDVALLNFTIVANAEVTFKKFPVVLVGSGSGAEGLVSADDAANFTNVKIMDTDSDEELMAAVDVTSFTTAIDGSTVITDGSDTTAYHIFTDEFTMEAGEELNLSLTVDVANVAALADMTIYATLPLGDDSSYPEVLDINSKTLTNSTTIVPASTVTGKTMTVKASSLTMSLAVTPSSGSKVYVKGTEDVSFVGFIFTCGDASGCLITDLNIYGAIDADGDGTGSMTEGVDTTNVNEVVNMVKLVDADGEDLTGYSSVAGTTGLVEFQNMDWQLEAGDSPVIYVVGDVESTMSTDDIAFYVKAATDLTVENDDNSTFTATGTPNGPAASVATYVTVKDGGQLTITVASDTADEDVIVAGSTDVEVAKFKFNAKKATDGASESFTVTDLSITNWQEGVATADLVEYHNNVAKVRIEYTNSLGDTVTKDGTLDTTGVATFSTLDFYVEKDGYAYLTVFADVNTIIDATAGETINFNLSFEDFSALSGSGQEKYTAAKLDDTVGSTADLDIGTLTFTTTAVQVGTADAGLTVGTTDTVTTADLNDTYPVGTMLKFGADATAYVEATEPLVILTSVYTDGDTTLTGYIANLGGDIAAADYVYYALPGTGYLTGTNTMYVYESKPTLTLNASSPSGSMTINSTDDVFMVDVTADDGGEITLRAATELSTTASWVAGVGALCTPAADTDAGDQVDGSGIICTTTGNTAEDTFVYDMGATGLLADSDGNETYARANFWVKWTDVGGTPPEFADLAINTGLTSAVTAPTATATALSATACGSDATDAKFVTAEWYNCDIALPTDILSTHQYVHVVLTEATELLATDTIHIDNFLLYNEKLVVDISTSEDLDSYANNASNAGGPVEALLLMDGDTYATAYVNTVTNGGATTNTATITFIPSTDIEIAAGSTETLTVQTDTTELIDTSTGDDAVSFSMDYGTSSTNGDFWWYETNATVKWAGDTGSTKLSSDTLIY